MIRYDRACRDGTWSRSPVFTLGTWPTFDLEGKTLGILGMGAIGREVARLAMAFGMRVLALKRDGVVYGDGFERLGLHGLAERSDFVSIHLPLTEESRHLVGGDFLKTMKRTAFLINMARGPIVDPAALALALETGTIKGAALDVMEQEPPAGDDPLLSAPNLIVTPHIAWASLESRRRLVGEIASSIAAFYRGEKRNVVS
jgi:glycerate dehydrogenase